MRTHSDNPSSQKGRRLDDLNSKTAELERELDDVRMLLKCELARGYDEIDIRDIRERIGESDARTETLVTQGRPGAYRPGLSNRSKLTIGIGLLAVLIAVLAMVLSSGGASWPASVATVQSQITKACQNPDVRSEPGQVDFACAQSTSQILWVFSLLTSGNNPDFNDTHNGRLGPGAHRGDAGRADRPLPQPAQPLQPVQPDRQPRGRRPGDQQHHRRSDRDRQRRPAGGPGRSGERARQLPAVHRFGRDDLARRSSPACAPSRSRRRDRPRWSLTSTRSGSSGRHPARRRTPRCCSRTRTTRGTRRSRRSSGTFPAQRPRREPLVPLAGPVATREKGEPMLSASKPSWQQVTALVSLSASGTVTGFSFVPHSPADLMSPTSMPVRLTGRCERSVKPRAGSGRRRDAALGHRQRRELLPPHGRGQDPGRDGGASSGSTTAWTASTTASPAPRSPA